MIKLTKEQMFELYLHEYGKTDYASYNLNPQKENGIYIHLKNGGTIEYTIDSVTWESSGKIMLSKQYMFKGDPLDLHYTKDEILKDYCDNLRSCHLGCVLCAPYSPTCTRSMDPDEAINKLIKANIIEEVK